MGRELSADGVNAVINKLIQTGNAEWEDASHTGLRIILKTPESLAGDIYAWYVTFLFHHPIKSLTYSLVTNSSSFSYRASRNGLIGTVLTLFELHSGDDYQDSGFYGADPIILKRALQVLEREGKCSVFEGANPGEEGVKFNPAS